MILPRLKQQTQPFHDRLERSLALLDRRLTLAEYRLLLQRMWGLYAPLEVKLARVLSSSRHSLDFERRRKTPLLRQDLHMLGVTEAELPDVGKI